MSNKFRIAVRKFEPFETATEKIWKSFCEETGCTTELEAVPMDLGPLYESTLGEENGLIEGKWDVVHINTDWLAEASERNCLEDLTSWIEKQNPVDYPQGWSDSLLNMQKFGDRILGLPFHDGPECLIYRKDLFEDPKEKIAFQKKYNKELKPPETWEELREAAIYLNRPEQNLYGTAFALYPDGHNTVFDFSLQLWGRGGRLTDDNGKVVVNSEEARQGMEFYRSILKDDRAVHPQCNDFDSVKSGMAFANGEIAMMVNWFGFASMSEVLPDSKVKGKVDITNVPSGPGGQGISLSVYWLYAIARGSQNKQLAYDFIRYATNVRNDKLLTLSGGIGCRKSTWSDAEVNKTIPYYHKLNSIHENVRTLPRKTNWSSIAHGIDEMMTKIISTDIDVADLLSDAQTRIDNIESA